MANCFAVLLDTVSIQKYIFRSNKLKENLGASYLVENIYLDYLKDAIKLVTGFTIDLKAWESCTNSPSSNDPVEIVYIGGGNALLFFQDKSQAEKFIEMWTKILLVKTPGLTAVAALSKFPRENEKFRKSLNKLFDQLKENKNKNIPITSIPGHGITAECNRSGLSAELYNPVMEEYVSSDVNARIEAATESKKGLEKKYKEQLENEFTFPDELDDLGGIPGEDSHIAIVHIDGNQVGKLFREKETRKEICELSVNVKKATDKAFRSIVKAITGENYKKIMSSLGFNIERDKDKPDFPIEHMLTEESLEKLEQEPGFQKYYDRIKTLKDQGFGGKNKFIHKIKQRIKAKDDEEFELVRDLVLKYARKRKLLPLRPIILGGDDVTFVCDGKLGIYLAQIYIKEFERASEEYDTKITACAGVSIIKTKYPFYRGYWLAEELCKNAKMKHYTKNKSASFLDFHISLGGVAGSLSDIRKKYYGIDPRDDKDKGAKFYLLYRPFIIGNGTEDEMSGLDVFLEWTCQLAYNTKPSQNPDNDDQYRERKKIPKNKLQELRRVLTSSEDAMKEFIGMLKYRKLYLPEIDGKKYHETLFDTKITPYFDMIELIQFYPDFALKKIGGIHEEI